MSAEQGVVQALQLLRGSNAVLPTLRAAAEQYHTQQSAPVNELAQLLAHVSIAAEQVNKQKRSTGCAYSNGQVAIAFHREAAPGG